MVCFKQMELAVVMKIGVVKTVAYIQGSVVMLEMDVKARMQISATSA